MARVHKARAVSPGGGRIIDGQVWDARLEAKRIVEEAEARARALEEGAEQVREEARRAGFAAGREEGLAGVTETLARARLEERRHLEELEPDLRKLAVEIARKILGRELALSPEAVVDVVRTALARARDRRELVVRVHPEDLAAVSAARPRLAQALGTRADVRVSADPAVGRGGCRIDTEVGTIDAGLETQLAAIERALCEPDASAGGHR